jgi:hypothetical protein
VAERIAEWLGKQFDQVDWAAVAQTTADALASAWGALTSGAGYLFNWLKNLISGIDWADWLRRSVTISGKRWARCARLVLGEGGAPKIDLGPLQGPLETFFRFLDENRGTIELVRRHHQKLARACLRQHQASFQRHGGGHPRRAGPDLAGSSRRPSLLSHRCWGSLPGSWEPSPLSVWPCWWRSA